MNRRPGIAVGNANFFLTFGLGPKEEIKIQATAQTDEHDDNSGMRCVARSGRKMIEQRLDLTFVADTKVRQPISQYSGFRYFNHERSI